MDYKSLVIGRIDHGIFAIAPVQSTTGIVLTVDELDTTVSRVFRLGKITIGDGFLAYENRTASGRVQLTPEQEQRWRDWMYGGNKQGGGGDGFISLTGLFTSKTGKSIVGGIKPDSFNTLFNVMKECHDKGVEMVFVVSGPGDKAPENMKGRLSVIVGKPDNRQAAAPKAQASGPFGAGIGTTAPAPAPQTSAAPVKTEFSFGTPANQPPKDELESFLEGFNSK